MKIATVYRDDPYERYPTHNMAMIRWLRISQGLSLSVTSVDFISDVSAPGPDFGAGVRIVGFRDVEWEAYDVILALYQRGFDTLARHGGEMHPFIVSSLATVVARVDGVPGVNVTATDRLSLWSTQERIAERARKVSVRTRGNGILWMEEFPRSSEPLLVATGVDTLIPPLRVNPFQGITEPVALYAGNLRRGTPGHLNGVWVRRLNELGVSLKARGIRLCFLGPSRPGALDPEVVLDFGPVPYEKSWAFKGHANVGIALAEDSVQLNESSKIYQYLRAGLPVVSEEPIPNNSVLQETEMGIVVPFGDTEAMADAVLNTIQTSWPRQEAAELLAKEHSWARRAEVYADWLSNGSLDAASVSVNSPQPFEGG